MYEVFDPLATAILGTACTGTTENDPTPKSELAEFIGGEVASRFRENCADFQLEPRNGVNEVGHHKY